MFIDTHVHVDSFPDAAALAAAVQRADSAGVSAMVAVGGNPAGNRAAVAAATGFPGHVHAAIGLDRDQAAADRPAISLEQELKQPGVVAVGEIGLDFHYHPETVPAQKLLFEQMLDLARRHRLPAIVHSREADGDTVDLLREHARLWRGDAGRLGVLHCFTGGAGFMRQLLDLGMTISFSGILTFRNADELRAVAREVPGDRLLIETDTPYLAPEPHRGKPNEPAYVVLVAEILAKIRNDTTDHIAHSTARNAEALFGLNRKRNHEGR